jgi:hypothetical protein
LSQTRATGKCTQERMSMNGGCAYLDRTAHR